MTSPDGVQPRDDLIEAAARVLRDGRIGMDDAGIVFPDEARVVGEDILTALLPLIADKIRGQGSYGMELRPDGSEDPVIAAYLEGIRDSYDLVRSLASAAYTPETDPGCIARPVKEI